MKAVWDKIMGPVILFMIIGLACFLGYMASSGNSLAVLIAKWTMGIIAGAFVLAVVGVIIYGWFCWLKNQWKDAGEKALDQECRENFKKCQEEISKK